MAASESPDPKLQFFANDGNFLAGGKLYTYAAGTSTPLATYTDYTATQYNSNPIILNSRGETSVWLGSSRYKFVLKDANDVEIWTQDNLAGSVGADGIGAYGAWPISITGNAATATTATYATTAGSANAVAPGAAITSINGAGLYGFSLTGGPITSSGTLTVTPPAPGASGNHMVSNGTNWVSQAFGGTSNLQIAFFASSTTWTAPAGVTKVRATVIGGGGGGAGYTGQPVQQYNGGLGGSATGYYTVTPGTVYTITVGSGGTSASGYNVTAGTGGTSSFSSFLSATGGTGANSLYGDGITGTTSGSNIITTINWPLGVGSSSSSPIVWSDGYLAGVGGTAAISYVYAGIGGVVVLEYVG